MLTWHPQSGALTNSLRAGLEALGDTTGECFEQRLSNAWPYLRSPFPGDSHSLDWETKTNLLETKIYHWKIFTSTTVLRETDITHAKPAKNKNFVFRYKNLIIILVLHTLQDNKIHLQNSLRYRCSRVNANDLLALDGLKLQW